MINVEKMIVKVNKKEKIQVSNMKKSKHIKLIVRA